MVSGMGLVVLGVIIISYCKQFILVILFLLGACGQNLGNTIGEYQWVHTYPPALNRTTIVTQDYVQECDNHGLVLPENENLLGCAVYQLQMCTMYIPLDAPQWVKDHENKHCDGWMHS